MKRCNPQYRTKGFNLVETLVALVVLSVGMLGIVSLYITSIRANGSATSRTIAVHLAADMADRIRANRNVPNDYADTDAAELHNCDEGYPAAEEDAEAEEISGTECTPEELAQHDLAVWLAELAAELPSGTGTIQANAATGGFRYVIQVEWNEPAEPVPLSYTLTADI